MRGHRDWTFQALKTPWRVFSVRLSGQRLKNLLPRFNKSRLRFACDYRKTEDSRTELQRSSETAIDGTED